MKRGVKTFATLGLSAILALGTLTTSFAAGWTFDGPENWKWRYEAEDGSRPVNQWLQIDGKWYHFDTSGYLDTGWHTIDEKTYFFNDDGAMVESGSWEGGFISSDGSFVLDELVGLDENFMYYRWSTQQYYKGTLPWKTQLLFQIIQVIDSNGYNSSFALDAQLPANWKELCPKPLMSHLVACAIENSDRSLYGYGTYSYNWEVDANNVIHITGSFQDWD